MAPFLNKLRCLKSSEPRGQRSQRLKNTAQNHALLNGKVGSDHSGKQGTDKKHDLRDGLRSDIITEASVLLPGFMAALSVIDHSLILMIWDGIGVSFL